jgi:protein NRD1
MSSAVAELDSYLQSMLQQKPPGVSGSKINSITTLCDANVQVRAHLPCLARASRHIMLILSFLPQSESVLIQKIYTHFKKAPGTHKLGVLYVVDSVTRRWVEQARKAGQPSGSAAPDGTFAAGVNRVTELLPVLMNDIIQSAPEDQKVRYRHRILCIDVLYWWTYCIEAIPYSTLLRLARTCRILFLYDETHVFASSRTR